MLGGEYADDLMAKLGKRDKHAAPILGRNPALNHADPLEPIDKLHRAIGLEHQLLREALDRQLLRRRRTDRQHRLILLRSDPRRFHRRFGNAEEAPERGADPGEAGKSIVVERLEGFGAGQVGEVDFHRILPRQLYHAVTYYRTLNATQ